MKRYMCNVCGAVFDTYNQAAMCCPDVEEIDEGPSDADRLRDWVEGKPIGGAGGVKLEAGKAYRLDKHGYVPQR